jgi:hypothetical protein
MEGTRFDHWAKQLVTRTHRRRVLQGVSGIVAAVLATTRGEELTAAKRGQQRKRRKDRQTRAADSPQRKCKQASRPCSFDTHCCSGSCCNKICCGPGQQCNLNGQCVCKPDNAAACAGRVCGSAVNNCGDVVPCGSACPQGQVCSASGACEYERGTCRFGDKTCGGVTVSCNEDNNPDTPPCFCWRTASGGTVCGGAVQCGNSCTTDSDCTAFGPRSVCVDIENCQCTQDPSPRACVRPCASQG